MPGFDHLAPVYGIFFPARPAQVDFLENSLLPGAPERWIDIACGSGQQLEALEQRRLEAWGLDSDQSMIDQLRNRRPDLAGRVFPGDMRRAYTILTPHLPGRAGVVYCIGNSLALLPSPPEMLEALRAFRNLLDPAGALVLQIVNFDRVLAADAGLLPALERKLPSGETAILHRRYLPGRSTGKLLFETRLELPEKTILRAEDLYPLRKEELAGLLARSGFRPTGWYGDFTAGPWGTSSPATIVRAARTRRGTEE